MPHVFETAPSGRARCRGCRRLIAKGELRFGERLPNPFAEGEMSLWFHPRCAACKRPQPFLEALAASDVAGVPADRDTLEALARESVAHRRLPRLDGAGRSPTGRATCRSCRRPIEKGSWRIGLVWYAEGRFEPSGYIHARCAREYLGTADVIERIRCFSDLTEDEAAEIRRELVG